ncbi:MAG: glycosylase [Planctomycetaceae bacterium]
MRIIRLASVVMSFALLIPVIIRADDFPPELVRFQQHGDKPVFTAAGPGSWEVKIRERGWIHLDPTANESSAKPKYRMWYTGYDGTREGIKRLGYATSADGIVWSRHKDNPLVDQHWVEDVTVVPPVEQAARLVPESKQASRPLYEWQMFAEGRDDQAQLLTSRDGVKWQRTGQLDVRKTNGQPIEPGPYGTPTVWLEEGVWHLFYERHDAGVWLATSRDLKVWTHVSDEPVLRPGQGLHDRDLIAMNQIVKHKGRYYAYYHGSAKGETPSLWSTCVAVSDDLRSWKKYDGNPLLPRERNRSSGIVIRDGDRFRLYTMHSEVWLHVGQPF